jgi:hypothetical protein
MKQTVNFHDFCDAWRNHGRNDSFTHEGKRALFDWIEQIDEDCGTETELDVVALDCDFSEHASAISAISDLGYDYNPEGDDDDEREEDAALWLGEHTATLRFNGGVIIQGF